MNLNDIKYKKDLTGSFMLLSNPEVSELDERILLSRQFDGFLDFTRYFVDEETTYWYNISGKQALDTYCQYNDMPVEFFEKIIISACAKIEMLERHLVSTDVLMLIPQMIYVSAQDGEIYFTAFPHANDIKKNTFVNLMEFMLTKLDHSKPEGVHRAYGLYEKVISEEYSIEDIRDCIIEYRKESMMDKMPEITAPVEIPEDSEEEDNSYKEPEETAKGIRVYLEKMKQWLQDFLRVKKKERKTEEYIVYPDECEGEEREECQIHPTVCLSDYREHPQGLLLYEGMEHFDNIYVKETQTRIGQDSDVEATINKETVSRLHAVISCENMEYYLEDMNSTNGTFVNEQELAYRERHQLKINDIVKFADVKYRFV